MPPCPGCYCATRTSSIAVLQTSLIPKMRVDHLQRAYLKKTIVHMERMTPGMGGRQEQSAQVSDTGEHDSVNCIRPKTSFRYTKLTCHHSTISVSFVTSAGISLR